MANQVTRGDVYWVTLHGMGSEQSGKRPVVVVQNDRGNASSPTTVVAIITTAPSKLYPFLAPLDGECGLRAGSVANCSQLFTIDRSRLEAFQGSVSRMALQTINAALIYELALK